MSSVLAPQETKQNRLLDLTLEVHEISTASLLLLDRFEHASQMDIRWVRLDIELASAS